MSVNSKLPKIPKSCRATQAASVLSALVIFLAGTFVAFAKPQESPTESVADAARHARELKAHSTKRVKLITNADLDVPGPEPNASDSNVASSLSDAAEAPALPTARTCDNPAARLKRELQASEQEVAHFRPGSSGVDFGSPPLSDSEPPAPARVALVQLQEKIASLQKALRIVCEPPEVAGILIKIDDLEQRLDLLQRQFALDQDVYYSKTNFAKDIAGRAQLDAEQKQTQDLQVQIALLRQKLGALKIPQP